MSNEGDEVFFVESTDDDDEGDVRTGTSGGPSTMQGRQGNLSTATPVADPPSPRIAPSHGVNASMEDVLFERPVAASVRQQRLDTLMNGGSRNVNTSNATSTEFTGDCPVPLEMLAGRSVNAVPETVREVPPRDLLRLRSMTCSEVRERLETFFLRKDANDRRFKLLEADMTANAREDAAKDVQPDLVTVRQRDRYERLVNTGNWGDGNDSLADVLLPAPLVATSAFYTQRGVVRASAGAGSGSVEESRPARTLRKHQIEGIRFMWNVLEEGPVGQVPAVGCILAHTMGLGKTAQVVLFVHLFAAAHRQGAAAPHPAFSGSSLPALPRILIVVPKSTVSVWEREFALWGGSFPAAHRLVPRTLDDTNGSPGSSSTGGGCKTPARRVRLFRQWRRQGGVFLVGYEALVRLMQLVEDDNALLGNNAEEDRGGHAGGSRTSKPDMDSGLGDAVQKQLKAARRRDEGGLAFGGAADPFTELVVCDEAHRLKSVHLQVVTALRGLHPLRRLLLTGTPLQNHLSEYWAMIDFAVHKYFDRHRFKDFFVRSIESSASKKASKQEVALAKKKTFTLINEVKHFVQRVDSSPLQSELPPLHEYVVVVPLSDLQKSIYIRFVKLISSLYDGKSLRFHFLPAVSFAGKIASHPQLLFAMRDQTRPGSGAAVSAQRQRQQLKHAGQRTLLAKSTGQRTRPQLKKKRKTERERTGRRRRESSDSDSVLSASASTSSTRGPSVDDDDGSSVDSEGGGVDTIDDEAAAAASHLSFSQLYENSRDYDSLCEAPPRYVPRLRDGVKLLVAMSIIQAAVRRDEKVLLFSLSTKLLDFFEALVAEANASRNVATDPVPIQYRRLDGSHSGAQRATMLSDFNREDSSLNLFLLSMKAGGVGITITAATRVILVDSSFNPADDQQAIGRAYRYGQTKPVFVYRLLCYQTLEFSIFEQKLAKEWLFKTVIDETSMKRDGLSGMHLRQIFSMLDRAAKAMQKAPRITQRQEETTNRLAQEDDVLREVRDHVLYAQRYEVFLSHDEAEQYGAEEQKYYDKYRKERMFDVGENALLPHELLERELSRGKRQREQQSRMLRSEAQTLTGLVDKLIRSRATTDPHLARLLTVMGLHVDPATGAVRSAAQVSNEAAAPQTMGGRIAAEDSGLTVPSSGSGESSRASDENGGDSDSDEDAFQSHQRRRRHRADPVAMEEAAGTQHRGSPSTVLLLDEEEEEGKGEGVGKRVGRAGHVAPLPENGQSRPEVVVDPSRYAPFRPGNSVKNAIDIDSD